MAWFSSVPIVDVHRDNFESIWPSLIVAIRNASFVALDAELSGLGPRRNLMLRSFDDRYKALREVCKSHSVLSLGLSCFKLVNNDNAASADEEEEFDASGKLLRFHVQTYNITLLCNEDYVVEPVALRFLVEHAFDFNKQYSQGVSYYRGIDQVDDKDVCSPRVLFSELLTSDVPIILHNGLIDLAFLYQNLYSDLPPNASQFICDMCEMFRGGVLDTKYVADFEVRMVASYLEYVFRKCQRNNARLFHEGKPYVAVEFQSFPKDSPFVEYHNCELPKSIIEGRPLTAPQNVCEQYAAHGHCINGRKCPQSHVADDILDEEEFKDVTRKRRRNQKKKERRRNKRKGVDHDGGEEDTQSGEPEMKKSCAGVDNGCHGDAEGQNGIKDEDGEEDVKDEDEEKDLKGVDEEMSVDAEVVSASQNSSNVKEGADQTPAQALDKTDTDQEVGSVNNSETNKDAIDDTNKTGAKNSLLKPQYAGCHRAGFDAFMTGFAMATFVSQHGSIPLSGEIPGVGDSFVEFYALQDLSNKLYLGGKDVPLQITKSHFSKPSANHREKMKRLRAGSDSKTT